MVGGASQQRDCPGLSPGSLLIHGAGTTLQEPIGRKDTLFSGNSHISRLISFLRPVRPLFRPLFTARSGPPYGDLFGALRAVRGKSVARMIDYSLKIAKFAR
jgi:hypothetical protein